MKSNPPAATRPSAERPAAPAAAPGSSKPPPTLGSVVRELRRRNDWTLKEMSERTGIPLSTLAKVEHDRLTLTYDKLQQLSQRLQIPMSSLFAETPEQPETRISGRRSVGRGDQYVRVNTQLYEYRYLCTELRRKRMIPVLALARAKTLEEFGPLVKHSGEEFIYVLEGCVEVHTELYEPVVLNTGEWLYIDSDMGHAYLAGPDCDEVLLLAVCSSAEEGLMETLLGVHGVMPGFEPPTAVSGNGTGMPAAKPRKLKKRA